MTKLRYLLKLSATVILCSTLAYRSIPVFFGMEANSYHGRAASSSFSRLTFPVHRRSDELDVPCPLSGLLDFSALMLDFSALTLCTLLLANMACV